MGFGKLWIVGVGPGAADLLTFRAVDAIRRSTLVIAPRAINSDESLARKVVEQYLSDKNIYEHSYSMIRDSSSAYQSWKHVAERIRPYLTSGEDVAHITIGDPHIYSTSAYLIPNVLEYLPEENLEIVPGISAFQVAASMFHKPLCIQEDRLLIMTATNISLVESMLPHAETIVLYKSGKHLNEIADLVDKHNITANVVGYGGIVDKECIGTDLRFIAKNLNGYMATVILHIGRRNWS